MNNYGFCRVAAAIPFGKIADIEYNVNEIIRQIKEGEKNQAKVMVFPELSLTSYTCGDLFQQSGVLEKCISGLIEIKEKTKDLSILSIVGLPLINLNNLYNCAAVINKGRILGIVPKSFLPSYREFYEPRWFTGKASGFDRMILIGDEEIPFGDDLLFSDENNKNLTIGIEICEDLWVPIPPSCQQALAGATLLCNLSASNALAGKNEYRKELVKNQSGRCTAAYLYCSSGTGESTTDIVFDAVAMIAENNLILSESERFLRENQIIYADIDFEKIILERIRMNIKTEKKVFRIIKFKSDDKEIKIKRVFSQFPFVPDSKGSLDERCREIFNIQASGLVKRLESIESKKVIIGVSGGLDSTLALLAAIKAFNILKLNIKNIIALTMPGFGTTPKTNSNIKILCRELGVSLEEVDIKDISALMLEKIKQVEDQHDVVYENIQARARTYLLMTKANKYNAIVLGTGDLSEIALGFSTYNGDHISMYNVNCSVPKTLVKFLIKWASENELKNKASEILKEILEQPISPELIPHKNGEILQKTEEKIGPYELHDFFLYYFVRFGFNYDKILFLAEISFKEKYNSKTIQKWLDLFFRRFFQNQWKRDCVPAGPKVGSVDLSPRGSWRMPSEVNLDKL